MLGAYMTRDGEHCGRSRGTVQAAWGNMVCSSTGAEEDSADSVGQGSDGVRGMKMSGEMRINVISVEVKQADGPQQHERNQHYPIHDRP